MADFGLSRLLVPPRSILLIFVAVANCHGIVPHHLVSRCLTLVGFALTFMECEKLFEWEANSRKIKQIKVFAFGYGSQVEFEYMFDDLSWPKNRLLDPL